MQTFFYLEKSYFHLKRVETNFEHNPKSFLNFLFKDIHFVNISFRFFSARADIQRIFSNRASSCFKLAQMRPRENFRMLGLLVASEKVDRHTRFVFYKYRQSFKQAHCQSKIHDIQKFEMYGIFLTLIFKICSHTNFITIK